MGFADIFKISKNKQEKAAAPRTLQQEEFSVVGMRYYEKNIKKISQINPDWKKTSVAIVNSGQAGKRIFRYTYINKPVKLILEHKNPHDKNAVQVVIAGELVGYISSDDAKHVREILSRHEIKFISSYFWGGQYKIVQGPKDTIKDEFSLAITVKIGYV